jgi:hypothetical protein
MNVLRVLTLQRLKGKARQVVELDVLPNDAREDGIAGLVIHVGRERRSHIQHCSFGRIEDAVEPSKDHERQDDFAVFGLFEVPAKELGYGPDEGAKGFDVGTVDFPRCGRHLRAMISP